MPIKEECLPKTGEITEHERLRRRLGFSVGALAEATGFSQPYVSQIEAGRSQPSARYRRAAAEVLGVPEAVLFPEAS